MRTVIRSTAFLAGLILWGLVCCIPGEAGGWISLTGVVHVHTSEFSSGAHTLDQLVKLARERQVDVIVLSDHDRIAMSYGLPPFPHLFSFTRSRRSVLKEGIRKYLARVDAVDAAHPEIILVPGLESAPFYYWTGALRSGELVTHDWRKHIHVIGLTDPRVIDNLPILDNGFSTENVRALLPRFLVYLGLLLAGVVLISWKGIFRTAGKVLLIIGILGGLDAQPFRSSPFDPYHGDQGVAPYQRLIDYVREHGGMTFWAHPEAHYGDREAVFRKEIAGISLPTVRMHTGPHPSDLVRTYGYTGFEALYGDTIHATDPGKEWDRTLLQYCAGKRKNPPWGICGLDFHRQGQNSWSDFRRGQTIFLVKEKSRNAVLDAMRRGRMYAVYQGDSNRFRLDDFSITTEDGLSWSYAGETVKSAGKPLKVHLSVYLEGKEKLFCEADLIDSGRLVKTLSGRLPLDEEYEFIPLRVKGYIRVEIRAPKHRIISNPIFYKRTAPARPF
ncbi:MAG: hypothetical protein GXP58_08070 [Deltaproteobacteria bacterium]|nr:hypothetical protein [Deltaproteobacteria bacterium]